MNDLEQDVPSAYRVVELRGRFYPLRFGKFRLDVRGYRISFGRRLDAEVYCRDEQRDYERPNWRREANMGGALIDSYRGW